MRKIKQRVQYASLRLFFKYIGGILPYYTANQAFKIFIRSPQRHLPRAIDDPLIKQSHVLQEEFEGNIIHGYHFGNGQKTIIVVHGYNSYVFTMRELIKKLLANGYSVIGFDAPGHGKSGGNKLNNEIYTRFLSQIFRKYHAYGVIGHSFGGVCSLLALMNTKLDKQIMKKVLIAAPVDSELILDQFFRHTRLNKRSIIKFRSIVDKQLIQDGWKMFCINKEYPQGFDFPGLILHDKDDTVIPHASATKLKQAWPKARLHTTFGLGHSDILRDKDSITQIIDYINAS